MAGRSRRWYSLPAQRTPSAWRGGGHLEVGVRIGRWVLVPFLALVAISAIAFRAPTARASASSGFRPPHVLRVGQTWTNDSFAGSASAEFSLSIFSYGLQLDESIKSGGRWIGTDEWLSPRVDGHCARPGLTVEPSGAAVLHCHAQRLWATPTRGTGHDNTLRVRDDGEVVVMTAAGRIVWRSGSGRALLGTGERLGPGQELRNCSLQRTPCDRLTMTPSGDLVLHRGGAVAWRTGTHVRGSQLRLLKGGSMVILGPAGHLLWASHTHRLGRSAYLIVGSNSSGTGPRIDLDALRGHHREWYRQ